MMIKIRLHGTEEEIKKSIEALKQVYDVLSISKPYKDRGKKYYRVYVDAELKEEN